MHVIDALKVVYIYLVHIRLLYRMKFLHAYVLFCFAGTSTASVQCTNDDLKTIAELQVSDVTSYPIAGDCISNLNSTMDNDLPWSCRACTKDNLSTDACKLCYASAASYAVAVHVISL